MACTVDGRHDRAGRTLSTSHWRTVVSPRLAGHSTHLADELVVGPSGVHVVVHARTGATARDLPSLRSSADAASHAGEVVAGLLPTRYRRVVRPLVCACRASDTGTVVAAVPVLAAGACRHTVLHAPRVLSTSEVQRVAHLLEPVLAPGPGAGPTARASRRLLWWSFGAVTTAAATVSAMAAGGGSTPW